MTGPAGRGGQPGEEGPSLSDHVKLERADDDSDVGWGEAPAPGGGDEDVRRLLAERPPHHDRD